jgi:hypothetical protein
LRSQTCAFTVVNIGATTGAFGIGFIFTQEPVIEIEPSRPWKFDAGLPELSTAFAYFAALPTEDIIARLSSAYSFLYIFQFVDAKSTWKNAACLCGAPFLAASAATFCPSTFLMSQIILTYF